MKNHARRRRKRRKNFTARHLVLTTWNTPQGAIEYRMGRNHGRYYVEKRYTHYAGLDGLTVRKTVPKEEALSFTPDRWIDP